MNKWTVQILDYGRGYAELTATNEDGDSVTGKDIDALLKSINCRAKE